MRFSSEPLDRETVIWKLSTLILNPAQVNLLDVSIIFLSANFRQLQGNISTKQTTWTPLLPHLYFVSNIYEIAMRGFHERTILAILASLPALNSHICSFLLYQHHMILVNVNLDLMGIQDYNSKL